MVAAKTVVPVIGVPVRSQALSGVDSLLSIVQMPAGGATVATMAIGPAGAVNAALYAAAIVGNEDEAVRDALRQRRAGETARVLGEPDPRG